MTHVVLFYEDETNAIKAIKGITETNYRKGGRLIFVSCGPKSSEIRERYDLSEFEHVIVGARDTPEGLVRHGLDCLSPIPDGSVVVGRLVDDHLTNYELNMAVERDFQTLFLKGTISSSSTFLCVYDTRGMLPDIHASWLVNHLRNHDNSVFATPNGVTGLVQDLDV